MVENLSKNRINKKSAPKSADLKYIVVRLISIDGKV